MKIKHSIALFIVILSISNAFAQDKKFKVHTVAFYNFENLFDTINDPDTYDEEYTPAEGWTLKNYKKKLDQNKDYMDFHGTRDFYSCIKNS